MLKMMAADHEFLLPTLERSRTHNDDAYSVTPGFILETVQAAKSMFDKGKILRIDSSFSKDSHGASPRSNSIKDFLDWP